MPPCQIMLSSGDPITLQIGGEEVTFSAGVPREVTPELQAELLARSPDQMWVDPDAASEGGE